MTMAIELTISKIDRGQRSDGSGHNEIDYNTVKWNVGLRMLLNLNVY